VFYIQGNEYQGRRYYIALSAWYKKFALVCLPMNRVDKFKRNVPSVKQVHVAVREAHKAWADKLTTDQKVAMHIAEMGGVKRNLAALDARKVHDPDLRDAIRLGKMDTSKLCEQRKAFDRVSPDNTMPKVTWKNPLEKYPLYEQPGPAGSRQSEHVYLYLNAAYAA
jgi:hypothetical protein